MIYKNLKKNRGYTLLFAVIVSAVVLSVGISILNISKKEFLLASAARESVSAFYAADSGLECFIYNFNKIATTSDPSIFKCLGRDYSMNPTYTNSPPECFECGLATYIFNLKSEGIGNQSCSIVTVNKFYQVDKSLGNVSVPVTNVEVRGYNIGWNSATKECTVNSPRRVERAIRYNI